MLLYLFIVALLVLSSVAFTVGRRRAMAFGEASRLHARPVHHGIYVTLWCVLPALAIFLLGLFLEGFLLGALLIADTAPALVAQLGGKDIFIATITALAASDGAGQSEGGLRDAALHYQGLRQIAHAGLFAVALTTALGGLAWGRRAVSPTFRAQARIEGFFLKALVAGSTISILTTVGIVLSMLFEAIRFFQMVPFHEFLFGLQWSPQTAIRPDQIGQTGAFGAVPVFVGTLLITFIAMCISVPIGIFAAIYTSEYASPRVRATVKPVLEILAGVPTVVYGFFAALTVAPLLREAGLALGLDIASESALVAGLVMGIMIIPFISSLSDDAINAVPQSLRDGSYAMGATQSETIRHVVLPAALPGIMGAFLLAVSRAIGETMIVVMAAGLAAKLTANPFEAVTTVTVQIVTLLVGDQEFDSAKTLAAFALGLTLFVITLFLNIFAIQIVEKYREKYD
ncbi:MAG: phosphate ABC transporter permease subunit PstC [Rhodospirillaceae bacterium]|nr:MAG: phosphate ABC transporter permease subunit PstC [Rhodospirillaceae bacterium]